jgi:phenylalanyl-tRNA synthetase beta chain
VAELYLDSFQMPKPSFESLYYCPSNYQPVKRDLAFLIDQRSQLGPIIVAVSNLRKDLIQKIDLFDIFQDNSIASGKKSFAITYWLQAKDRTLTDPEINQVQQQIIDFVYEEFNATLRV